MKKVLARRLLAELRDHVKNGVPHDLVFKPAKGTKKDVQRLQASLDESFDLWRETWIYPWIEALEILINETKPQRTST